MTKTLEVSVAAVRLTVDVSGLSTSPKMVLLHALGDGRHSWAMVAEYFAQRFEVFTPDLRGHGDSDSSGHYSFEAMRDDVTGLLDHLGWDRAHVMGISFGGMVAQNLVVRHPERVDRLVLACTSPGGEGGSSADLLAMAALAPERRADASLALTDTRYVSGADTLPPGMDFYAEFVENRPTPASRTARWCCAMGATCSCSRIRLPGRRSWRSSTRIGPRRATQLQSAQRRTYDQHADRSRRPKRSRRRP